MSDRTPTIVGIAVSDYPKAPHLDAVQHQCLALQRVLADSGIDKRDIDGPMAFEQAGLGPDDVDTLQLYPRAICTSCGATPAWEQASGRGVVHTFTVIRQNHAAPDVGVPFWRLAG